MLSNLEAEITRNKIRKEDIAARIGKSYGTLTQKIKGNYPFTYKEALTIQEDFFPECDFKELFTDDND